MGSSADAFVAYGVALGDGEDNFTPWEDEDGNTILTYRERTNVKYVDKVGTYGYDRVEVPWHDEVMDVDELEDWLALQLDPGQASQGAEEGTGAWKSRVILDSGIEIRYGGYMDGFSYPVLCAIGTVQYAWEYGCVELKYPLAQTPFDIVTPFRETLIKIGIEEEPAWLLWSNYG